MELKDIIGSIVAVLAFLVTYLTYHTNEKWKKSEIIATQVKAFNEKTNTKNAKLILDWYNFPIELLPNSKEVDTNELLIGALRDWGGFSEDQKVVRLIFDEYLDDLEHFAQMVKSGLVSTKDLGVYLKYWVDILNGDRPRKSSPTVAESYQNFIKAYHPDALLLLKAYKAENQKKGVDDPLIRRAPTF